VIGHEYLRQYSPFSQNEGRFKARALWQCF
jgi:hypothetical protein